MSKKQSDKLIKMLKSVLTDKEFLKEIGMTADELAEVLPEPELQKLNQELLATVEQENGMSRFSTLKVADIMSETLEKLGETPEEGWAVYSYRYVLNRLFPEPGSSSAGILQSLNREASSLLKRQATHTVASWLSWSREARESSCFWCELS